MKPVVGTLLVALQGIGTALVLTFGGVYLQRIGTLSAEHTRSISVAYKQLFLPMLLFTRTAMVLKSTEDLALGVNMTIANILVVSVGMIVGHLLCIVFRPSAHFRRAFRVLVWMNNVRQMALFIISSLNNCC